MKPLQKFSGLTIYIISAFVSFLYTAFLYLLRSPYGIFDLSLVIILAFISYISFQKIDWRQSPRIEVILCILGILSYSFPPLFSLILFENTPLFNGIGLIVPYILSGYIYIKAFHY